MVYNFQLCTESRLKLERWIFRHAAGGGGGGGQWQSPTLAAGGGGRGGGGGGRGGAVPNSGGPVVTFDGLERYEYPMSYWEPDCMHPAPTKKQPTNKKDRKRRRKKREAGREPGTPFFPLHSLGGRGVGYRGRRNGWLLLLRARPEPSKVVLNTHGAYCSGVSWWHM